MSEHHGAVHFGWWKISKTPKKPLNHPAPWPRKPPGILPEDGMLIVDVEGSRQLRMEDK
jgi:hypothetical protein